MKDIKLLLELSSKMLMMAKDEFDNHGCNDLDEEIYKLIPEEWCEEARQMNSKDRDSWPEEPYQFGDSGLMWFLSKKLKNISTELDRDIKLNDLGI
jgi:hypothetical protein